MINAERIEPQEHFYILRKPKLNAHCYKVPFIKVIEPAFVYSAFIEANSSKLHMGGRNRHLLEEPIRQLKYAWGTFLDSVQVLDPISTINERKLA